MILCISPLNQPIFDREKCSLLVHSVLKRSIDCEAINFIFCPENENEQCVGSNNSVRNYPYLKLSFYQLVVIKWNLR